MELEWVGLDTIGWNEMENSKLDTDRIAVCSMISSLCGVWPTRHHVVPHHLKHIL